MWQENCCDTLKHEIVVNLCFSDNIRDVHLLVLIFLCFYELFEIVYNGI